MWSAHELIVAAATVPGPGARAVIRLAGDGLEALLARLFAAEDGGFPPVGDRPRVGRARLTAEGLGREWGQLEVGILQWPGPGGPIGGPLAEVQLPASKPLVDAVIAEACRCGARLARGGEFTLRAFLTGRLDLAQAEAVLAVVDAQTPQELTAALDRMAGGAGRTLALVRDGLIELLADLEAAIDFADETTPDDVPVAPVWTDVIGRLEAAAADIAKAATTLARRDASAADLPRVVLVGRPNIGKSSLFNALVGREAALVADESGTTRDWLEARIDAGDGRTFVLVDLAGLADPSGLEQAQAPSDAAAIDTAAARRARAEIARADVLVVCRDAGDAGGDPGIPEGVPRIDVLTRCDRAPCPPVKSPIATSSVSRAGVADLDEAMRAAVEALPPRGQSATLRMAVGAEAAAVAVAAACDVARAAVAAATPDEALVAGCLRTAVDALSEVTGIAVGPDLLDRIFSRHCIGK
jgi:tRNA modification GTPase